MDNLVLSLLAEDFVICRNEARIEAPATPAASPFWCLTRTADEVSLICAASLAPEGWRIEKGWRGFKVEGPLDFSLIGILAKLTTTLAGASISVSAVSTFDTDYLFVKEENLAEAINAFAKVSTINHG